MAEFVSLIVFSLSLFNAPFLCFSIFLRTYGYCLSYIGDCLPVCLSAYLPVCLSVLLFYSVVIAALAGDVILLICFPNLCQPLKRLGSVSSLMALDWPSVSSCRKGDTGLVGNGLCGMHDWKFSLSMESEQFKIG